MSAIINHLGITVGDIHAAVAFYTSVFDLAVLVPPQFHSTDTPAAERRRDVFGPHWGGMKLAHLANDAGMGFELFEFVAPASQPAQDAFEYWRQGHSHVCLTVADLDLVLARLIKAGGKQRSQIHQVNPQTRIVYCEDPWGAVLELSTGTYHQLTGTAHEHPARNEVK
ncbi:MAG: VOC family protein [Paracoccaceae bacterium]